MSWNVQGKALEDLHSTWPVLDMDGFDVIGLQELGGFAGLSTPWKIEDCQLDGKWIFYITNPPLAHWAVAIGIPARFANNVDHVRALSVGICVTLKFEGCKQFVISAHLPHKQRKDCVDTWQLFESELEQALRYRRIHDSVVILTDTNYELGLPHELLDPNSSDERGLIVGNILRDHGLVSTKPQTHTWSNTRGSHSKIDFVLLGSTGLAFSSQGVFDNSDYQLGSDHRAVYASFPKPGIPSHSARKRNRNSNRCGKWRVNSATLLEQAAKLAEDLDLKSQDLDMSKLCDLSSQVSFRPKSYRYVDPDFIRDKIRERKLLGGSQARALGKEITALRRQAKATWLTSVLDKASKSDFFAISYFKRRNSVINSHSNYIVRAGGKQRATADLRRFFSLKYTPPDNCFPDLPLRILARHSSFSSPPPLITVKEIADVINTCKLGKSCGSDGISYEFLAALISSDLAQHFADFYNAILFGNIPIPDSWLLSHLTFIPKLAIPSEPKHLRPIVLSSTPGKVFTGLHPKLSNSRWLHLFATPRQTESGISSPPNRH